MDMQKIENMAEEAMKDRKVHEAREPGFVLYHGRRVAAIAAQLNARESMGVDAAPLYAGALCHDIGKGQEPHHEVGARLLGQLLPGCDCTAEEQEAICEIVRNHNRRHEAECCSLAARLVQDADVLDHVGTIGVWLSFNWAAEHDQSIHDALALHHSDENARFHNALRRCLNFDSAREALECRLSAQDQFFEDLARQHEGALW